MGKSSFWRHLVAGAVTHRHALFRALARVSLVALVFFGLWLPWQVADHLEFDHEPMMLRGWLCAVAAFLAVLVGRRGGPGDRWVHASILAVIIGAGAYLGLDRAPDQDEKDDVAEANDSSSLRPDEESAWLDAVNPWSGFHYYLGNRYFAEVGYDGLYEEALKADAEGTNRLRRVKKIRSMDDYERVAADRYRHEPRRPEWTDERWAAFKHDLDQITELRSPSYWEGPLADRGYNPSPAWTAVAGLVLRHADLDSTWGRVVLVAGDPLLIVVAFAVSVWAYGWTRSLLVLGGLVLWYGSYDNLVGKLWQFDWLAASWIGLACLRRRLYVVAGAVIAYATAARVFPGVLLCGPAAATFWYVLRHRRLPRSAVRFFGSVLISAVLLVGFSSIVNGRGPRVWLEFSDALALHMKHHTFGNQRVGFDHLLTLNAEEGFEGEYDGGDDRRNYRHNKEISWAARGAIVLAVLLLARGRSLHEAAVIGLPILFFWAVSSRYYAAMYALLLLRGAPATHSGRGPPPAARAPALVALDSGFLGLLACVHFALAVDMPPVRAYLWGDTLLTTYFVARVWVEVSLRLRRSARADPVATEP